MTKKLIIIIIDNLFAGVENVSTDSDKDLVTVKGTMDMKDLLPYLKEKLKRPVEIVPPKKDDGGGDKKAKESGGEKKEKEGGAGGGDKKDGEKKEGGGGGGEGGDKGKPKSDEVKMEVSKMEYHGHTPYTYYGVPVYNQQYANQDYGLATTYYQHPGYGSTSSAMDYSNHYHHHQQHVPPPPPPVYLPANDQMFSDENPNACFVM